MHKPVAPSFLKQAIRRDWQDTCEALAIGALGGLLFGWLGLPAGYLSGAMLAVALASLLGRPLRVPAPVMHITSAIIGITLGSVATPGLMHGFGAYPVSLAVLGASTAAVVSLGILSARRACAGPPCPRFLQRRPAR